MDRLRPDEQLAAEVLASRLDASIDPKDVGGAQATHEFDLVLPDGHRIAVEVTTATDQDEERLSGQASRPCPAPMLMANWNVWLDKDPEQNLKTLLPLFEQPLAVLERHDVAHVGRFVTPPENPEAAEAAQRIAELGAHRALRLAVVRGVQKRRGGAMEALAVR